MYKNLINSFIIRPIFFLVPFIVLLSCNPQQEDVITIKDEGSHISFSKSGKPIFTYQTTGALPRQDIRKLYLRGGYLHPVYTPSGKIITGDYPINHVHHHGIWAAWTKTVFEERTPDFWNMGDSTGTVKFVHVDSLFSGPDYSGFLATHQYVDMTGDQEKVVLEEQWEVKVYNKISSEKPYYLFDLNIVQHAVTSSPLILPQYHYGGIGFRGPDNWDGSGNAEFFTSEGKDRSNGNETRARWCHVGGLVENEWVGITVLGHKDNFRFPQPVRIHPDEPFLCFAPSQLGEWVITKEKPYQAKYRFVVYDGKPDIELLNKLWEEYNL